MKHLKQMHTSPQLAFLDLEEQQLYLKLLSGDPALRLALKGVSSHFLKESPSGRQCKTSYFDHTGIDQPLAEGDHGAMLF